MKFNLRYVRNSRAAIIIRKYKLLTYSGLLFLTLSNFMLRSKVNMLSVKVEQVKAENVKLISDMVYFNRSFEDFPWPVWQKAKRGDKFVMQYVNPAYQIMFLEEKDLSRYAYMGRTDFEIYDRKTAKIFYRRDIEMAQYGGSKRFNESVLDEYTEERINIDVLKWRVIERKDTLIYGMVIPKKE